MRSWVAPVPARPGRAGCIPHPLLLWLPSLHAQVGGASLKAESFIKICNAEHKHS